MFRPTITQYSLSFIVFTLMAFTMLGFIIFQQFTELEGDMASKRAAESAASLRQNLAQLDQLIDSIRNPHIPPVPRGHSVVRDIEQLTAIDAMAVGTDNWLPGDDKLNGATITMNVIGIFHLIQVLSPGSVMRPTPVIP